MASTVPDSLKKQLHVAVRTLSGPGATAEDVLGDLIRIFEVRHIDFASITRISAEPKQGLLVFEVPYEVDACATMRTIKLDSDHQVVSDKQVYA